ncbi:MAG: HlyC/CorC family transporter [Oscillospiraceae bacterium]|nr:HlyC/CorC family transporter [Oscillospiraceae bacterium]
MDADSLLLFIFFLLCSAYCASAETAYTAVSRVRLRTMADKGNRKAKKALWVCDRFDKTLTTVLIGNNIFHASCASLSTLLVMKQFSSEYVVYGTLLTTIIVYLFAEMLPKSIAKVRSEEIVLLYSGSMALFVKILTPVSFLFSGISAIISRLFASEAKEGTVTEEDLLTIIETIEDEGVLEPEKQELINSAIEFASKVAEDIMIPIEEMVSVSSTTPIDELAAFLKTSPYSRVPVYEGSEDNIVGILPVTVFLSKYAMKAPVSIRKLLMKPYVFDRNTEITELLSRMRLNKLHMVFICDENRKKLGIITMEDILEELVGDIQDESDTGEGLQLM